MFVTRRYGGTRKKTIGRYAAVAALVPFLSLSMAALGQDAPGRTEAGHWREIAPGIAVPEPQPLKACRFRQLRFSPDGKYILAQHTSGITVLTVDPLSVLFSRNAENISNAGFTPDSQQVWFVSRPSHVVAPQIAFAGSSAYLERWRIADATRLEMKETRLRRCESSKLSPDSRVLACVDSAGTLRIIDVDSDEALFEKRKFGGIGDRGSAGLNFSTDGRYLAAVPKYGNGPTVAWDLHAKEEVKLGRGLRNLEIGYHIAFVAPDRVMISSVRLGSAAANATLVEFPSGKVLSKAKLPPGQLFWAADPAFVLIRPFGWPVSDSDPAPKSSAVEYRTGQVIMKDAQALDVFGSRFIMELTDGKLGLCERGKGVQASVAIEAR